MHQRYDKLVRDRVPQLIRKEGRKYGVSVLSEADYRTALRAKLVEEAQEAASCEPQELSKELADLLQVIDAVRTAHGISKQQLAAVQKRRVSLRGAFTKRLMLNWAERNTREH